MWHARKYTLNIISDRFEGSSRPATRVELILEKEKERERSLVLPLSTYWEAFGAESNTRAVHARPTEAPSPASSASSRLERPGRRNLLATVLISNCQRMKGAAVRDAGLGAKLSLPAAAALSRWWRLPLRCVAPRPLHV